MSLHNMIFTTRLLLDSLGYCTTTGQKNSNSEVKWGELNSINAYLDRINTSLSHVVLLVGRIGKPDVTKRCEEKGSKVKKVISKMPSKNSVKEGGSKW